MAVIGIELALYEVVVWTNIELVKRNGQGIIARHFTAAAFPRIIRWLRILNSFWRDSDVRIY